MRKISLKNYEEFFLDYAEGKLSAEELSQLNSFLIIHPELKEELEDFEIISLKKDFVIFDGKLFLKKENELAYAESLMVGKLEGDLNDFQQQQLTELLEKKPELQTEIKLLEQTVFRADFSIVYPNKQSLKKSSVVRKLYIPFSIAASLLLVIGVYFSKKEQSNNPQYADRLTLGSSHKTSQLIPNLKEERVEYKAEKKIIEERKEIKLIACKTLRLPELIIYDIDVSPIDEPFQQTLQTF